MGGLVTGDLGDSLASNDTRVREIGQPLREFNGPSALLLDLPAASWLVGLGAMSATGEADSLGDRGGLRCLLCWSGCDPRLRYRA